MEPPESRFDGVRSAGCQFEGQQIPGQHDLAAELRAGLGLEVVAFALRVEVGGNECVDASRTRAGQSTASPLNAATAPLVPVTR